LGGMAQEAHLADANVAQNLRTGTNRQIAAELRLLRHAAVGLRMETFKLLQHITSATVIREHNDHTLAFLTHACERLMQRPAGTMRIRHTEQVSDGVSDEYARQRGFVAIDLAFHQR